MTSATDLQSRPTSSDEYIFWEENMTYTKTLAAALLASVVTISSSTERQ